MRPDHLDLEARRLQHPPDRPAVEVPEVHGRQEQPPPAERPGDPAADVRVVDDQQAARLEQLAAAVEHRARIRRVLDDVPQRDDVEAAGRVVLIEHAALADADAVVASPPTRRASDSARSPRRPSPRRVAAATNAPAAVPMSSSRPAPAGQPLDLAERRGEGALARGQLRHVGRVLALGVAREDEIVAQPRVDVLQPAACGT